MTTKTDITQERSDFEAAYAAAYSVAALRPNKFDREDWGDYVDESVGIGWRMWQAGRASLQSQPKPLLPNAPGWPKWYVVSKQGHATLYKSEADALDVVRLRNDAFPKDAPHTAMPLMPALQSKHREDALVQAIQEAIALLGPEAPSCSGCEYEWNHALRVLHEAIDHARRAEKERT